MDEEFNIEEILGRITDRNVDYGSLDWTRKEIGDRVLVINQKSISNINHENPVEDFELIESQTFIVIDININYKYNVDNITHIQDIIIAEPKSKKTYRVSSYHLSLIN